MAVFSASLGVDMSSLLELSGLFSDTLAPANPVYGATDISYDVIVTSPVMHVDFSGSFEYDGGGSLIGGTMNAITVAEDGVPAYSITGLSAPVETLLADAAANNVMSFFYGLFAGPDRITASSGDNQLWGLGGNDTIIAGSGNDTLYGGPGNDLLIGGSGQDHFVFNTKLGKTNLDTVADFHGGRDHIDLWEYVANGFVMASHTVMHRLFFWSHENHGPLAASAFHIGPHATAKSQHIIYDRVHGALYYHPDGSPPTYQVLFAKLPGHPLLTYHDFSIVA